MIQPIVSHDQNQIFKAFIAAQKEFGPALKTSTNPHFKSRYADLSACVEAIIDALHANELAVIQSTHHCENGVIVETILIHSSGQQMSFGVLHVPASKHDAQGYGSALTYARRYSLMSAMGIAPEDDDGNKASQQPKLKTKGGWLKVEYFYDIRKMDSSKIGAAVKYLHDNHAKLDENTGLWSSPTELDRLADYLATTKQTPVA